MQTLAIESALRDAIDPIEGAHVAENTLSLNKTFVLFGFAAFLLTLFAMFATMPNAGRVEARERAARSPCHTEEVSLDQGYGVSRIVQRRVCDDY